MPTFTSRAPSESGYMDQSAATTNSNGATLYIGDGGTVAAARTLIQYDLSSIPASATVISASLALTVLQDLSSNARTVSAYRLLRNWVHTQFTWNVYSTGNNWGTAGGSNATDREQTDIGTVAVAASPSLGTVYTINLTASAVQEWISGAVANNGLLLQVDTETNDQLGYYGINAVSESNRPLLTVVYTVMSGTSSIAGGLTGTLAVNKYSVTYGNVPKTRFKV